MRRFADVEAVERQLIKDGHFVSGQSVKSKKRDEDPMILKVWVNHIPESATFLSGSNIYAGGGICPESLFQEDKGYTLECTLGQDDAAQLLLEQNFPIEKFNVAMLLDIDKLALEKTNVVKEVNSLDDQVMILTTKYATLQQLEQEIQESRNSSERLEKTAIYLNRISVIRQETIKYLMDYVHKILLWEQLSNWYVRDYSGGILDKSIRAINEGIKIINDHKMIAANLIQSIGKDQFLLPFLSLFGDCRTLSPVQGEMDERQRLVLLKQFYRHWGRHAEDALIFKILQNLEEYDCVPEVIEIYGDEDPCFQCQVKLQWLADNLAGMINKARENRGLPSPITREPRNKLKIVYYAKKEFRGPCLINLPDLENISRELATRAESEKNRILVFKFTEGVDVTQPIVIEADAPPRRDFNVQLLWSPERGDSDSGPQSPISMVKPQ